MSFFGFGKRKKIGSPKPSASIRTGVTGHRSFIGRHLAYRIEDPVCFDGDLRDLSAVRAFTAQCDRIYHLADENRTEDGRVLASGLVGTGNLVLACLQASNRPGVIFASSKQVLDNWRTEYGLTKLAEEELIQHLDKWCIFRVPDVYGPGATPEYSVVAAFANRVARGKEVTVRDQQAKQPLIYIDDLVGHMLKPTARCIFTLPEEVLSLGSIHELLTTRLGEHTKLERCLLYEKTRLDESYTKRKPQRATRRKRPARAKVSLKPCDFKDT